MKRVDRQLKKATRTVAGTIMVAVGIVFTVLPGSILLVIGGLMLLSVDYPKARRLLAMAQRSMSRGARRLDAALTRRKLNR
ncbi:PGPGW domain-containing protein [Alteromonas sediminis]